MDSEFTRPGIQAFLVGFKKKVEAVNEDYDEEPYVRFNFETRYEFEFVDCS